MKRLAPRVVAWVERMVNVKAPSSGEFLPDDEVPATLIPLLERMMGEQMPFLQRTANMFASWTDANSGEDIPRAVGMAEFHIEGVSGRRMAPPFSLWMLQRPLDFYRSLNASAKTSVDHLLGSVHGSAGFNEFKSGPRLAFEDFRLKLA